MIPKLYYILKANPYENITVYKTECLRHVQKQILDYASWKAKQPVSELKMNLLETENWLCTMVRHYVGITLALQFSEKNDTKVQSTKNQITVFDHKVIILGVRFSPLRQMENLIFMSKTITPYLLIYVNTREVWGLLQQIRLVETHLAILTIIYLDKKTTETE